MAKVIHNGFGSTKPSLTDVTFSDVGACNRYKKISIYKEL